MSLFRNSLVHLLILIGAALALRSYTFGDLAERVNRFGNVLNGIGLEQEDRIMLCLLDTIDFPTTFLGSIQAGVVPIAANTLLTTADYDFMLGDSRASALVVSEALWPQFEDIIGRHFRQPKEGLGMDNTPASHMWRTIIAPTKFL